MFVASRLKRGQTLKERVSFLTIQAPITTAADDNHKKYFNFFFSEKIRLDVSSESSARQRIHMKHQALFSSNDKSKKLKCRLLQFLFGSVRFKSEIISITIGSTCGLT